MGDIVAVHGALAGKAVAAAGGDLTVAEYFAGIGLFRMGLEAAGWRVVYANDWSEKRAQIYRGFFGEGYDARDVFAVSARDVPRAMLATCSFPCVDLSLAGKGAGIGGARSGAFWGFCRVLREQGEHAPPIVLLENVAGWLYSNGGADFYATAKALNDLGYACDAFMLNARSFVPQSRPRVFMVGVKGDAGVDAAARRTGRSDRLMPRKLRQAIEQAQGAGSVWTGLDVPEPPPYKDTGLSDCVVERLATDDARWWPADKVGKHLGMMSKAHLGRVERLAQGDVERYRTFFRRRRADGQRAEVRRDDIAGCLRTAAGGSGKQFLVAAGKGRARMRTLTAREYARLQGVPDRYPIASGSERQSLDAFGDAVCVPVVAWIAREVLGRVVGGVALQADGMA